MPKLRRLAETAGIAFTDNCVRLDAVMTWGELAMLLAPRENALAIREEMIRRSGKAVHPYAGAMSWCTGEKLIPASVGPELPVTELPESLFDPVTGFSRREVYAAYKG